MELGSWGSFISQGDSRGNEFSEIFGLNSSLRTSVREREVIRCGALCVDVHGGLGKAMRFTKEPKRRLLVLFPKKAMVIICLFLF